MNIVAHEDDDLLFLSPDLIHDVQAGRCVRTVFVTAGAFSGDTDYGAQREAGCASGHAVMAGVANSWTTTDAGISGHPMPVLTLAAKPTVSLVFIRLPQSLHIDPGAPTDPLLKNLWNATIASLRTYDGSSTYTKAQLVSTLTSLMTYFQPDTVRTQDYVGTFSDSDHPDHNATAYFARQAHLAYSASHTFTGYADYETENEPQNVFGSDLTAKTNAFNAYATFDTSCDCRYRGLHRLAQAPVCEGHGVADGHDPADRGECDSGERRVERQPGDECERHLHRGDLERERDGHDFVLRDANGNAVPRRSRRAGRV